MRVGREVADFMVPTLFNEDSLGRVNGARLAKARRYAARGVRNTCRNLPRAKVLHYSELICRRPDLPGAPFMFVATVTISYSARAKTATQ